MDDYELLRQLSYEYTFRLDGGDFAGLGELFRHGRMRLVWLGVTGEWFEGSARVEHFYRTEVATYDAGGIMLPLEERGNPRTRHLISNHAIRISGTAASAKSYFTVLAAPVGQPFRMIITGSYEDSFEKIDGDWRFTEKTIAGDYINDVIYHARQHTARSQGQASARPAS